MDILPGNTSMYMLRIRLSLGVSLSDANKGSDDPIDSDQCSETKNSDQNNDRISDNYNNISYNNKNYFFFVFYL